ncbi:hypothetical protein AGOR_G00119540 [Albula goreensis]|uniref:Butyrophilin subfamily 3 member A2-like Ig-C domain-containing protein n=1 Tax=Albula goreensis TaxID=1534307 RepID=A0A8T3DF48_9TELE|nr:hypothetical protein AGOR_G00119540 [Albula goreensis]
MAVLNMKLVAFMTVVLFQTGITLTGLHVVIQEHNVTASYQEEDAGLYICEVWSGGYSLHGQDSVNLSVAAKPSVLDFVSKESNSLSFNSYGWFPKPHIFWTDRNNMSMIANTNISQGKDGLYSIQTVLHPDTNHKTYKLHLMFISPHSGKNQTEVFMQKAAVADSCQRITTTGSIILGVFVGFGIIVAVAVHKCWGQNSTGGLSLLAKFRSTRYGSVDGGRCRPQN